MPAISILDLVRVTRDTDARGALDNARDLAAHAETWGYTRFWVAEHHNAPGIASAATSIVIGHIAAVYLAHAMALRVFGEKRAALRSQLPMLALMIGYTMVSLWIIAQPIVSSRFG